LSHLSLLFICLLTFMSFIITEPEPVTIKLPAGTAVKLETTRIISTETLQAGQMIDLKVTADVLVDGKVVIPAGSIANGQVTRADKPKALGREGRIEIQIKSVKAIDGQDIPLSSGAIFKEGEDKQTLAIVLGLLLCILCLLIKGKDAIVPIGTPVAANVASNSEIEIK
jgi:hypothetical protein